MIRAVATVAAVALAACGAPAVRRDSSTGEAAALVEEAAARWGALDTEGAAERAERALAAGGGDDAREIAGRAHLALGRFDRAERALGGVSDPVLLRLRARAQMGLGRWDDAAASLEAAGASEREEDPWAASVLGAVRAARDAEAPYARAGAARAELALEELALPVVRVRADARETLALVATGADLVVVDPSLRDASGTLDELDLGGLRLRDVPYVTRSLADVRSALEAEVGLVLGLDLLLRLSATIDGPGGRLVLHAEPPAREPATSAPFYTPGGSFLVVPVRAGEAEAWMTLDTGGLFPVALAPGGDAALGLEGLAWQEAGGASLATAPALRFGALVVEELPVVRGLLDEGHARALGAPSAGSVGWALLGQLRLALDARERRVRFE
ncbi:MAG: hypothetical protein M5U28_27265 [Sandaracinaceae bacterium]|nr:hypothetical protein [Sandaracinaceae bacterium]